jgi:hypothetical protein
MKSSPCCGIKMANKIHILSDQRRERQRKGIEKRHTCGQF